MAIKIIGYAGSILPVITLLLACTFERPQITSTPMPTDSTALEQEKLRIDSMLTSYHAAAARADFDAYFNHFTDDAVFIGTDATELWHKPSFMAYSKPYFDQGKTWSFTAVQRNIYMHHEGTMAWFDELLDTRMKLCRGSGVAIKHNNAWKVQHYVLSMTIPNSQADTVIAAKAPIEDALLDSLMGR